MQSKQISDAIADFFKSVPRWNHFVKEGELQQVIALVFLLFRQVDEHFLKFRPNSMNVQIHFQSHQDIDLTLLILLKVEWSFGDLREQAIQGDVVDLLVFHCQVQTAHDQID